MIDREELIRQLQAAVVDRLGKQDSLALSHWSEGDWGSLLKESLIIERRNGDILIEREAAGDDLFFLVQGALEISMPLSSSLSIAPLISVSPGSIVGEIAFFDAHGRSASVWSRGRSVLFKLSRAAFDEFRARHPELASDLLLAIAQVLAGRLRRAQGSADPQNSGGRKLTFF